MARNQRLDNKNMSCIMSDVNSPMQLSQDTPKRSAMVRKACMHMRPKAGACAVLKRPPAVYDNTESK